MQQKAWKVMAETTAQKLQLPSSPQQKVCKGITHMVMEVHNGQVLLGPAEDPLHTSELAKMFTQDVLAV